MGHRQNQHHRRSVNGACGRRRVWSTPALVMLCAGLLGGCASTASGVSPDGLGVGDASMYLLRSQAREAQRVIADLQAQLDESRQTLAASQMARARLQGQVRELGRRYDEAHQVVELQREELARLREEREEVLRTSRQLQVQLTRLQRRIGALGPARGRQTNGADSREEPEQATAMPVADAGAADAFLNGQEPGDGLSGIVVVRRGDSLWKIARRHGVSLAALRTLNGLDDNPDLIYPGQELVLP